MSLNETNLKLVASRVTLLLKGEKGLAQEVRSRLVGDFASFGSAELPNETHGSFTLVLRASASARESKGHPKYPWSWRGSKFRGLGRDRHVYYDAQTQCTLSGPTNDRRAELSFEDANIGHEIAFNLILSAVGEQLDLAQGHRLHALAFRHRPTDQVVAILAASGVGKSTLALCLMRDPDFEIFSDESPWLRQEGNRLVLHPFPLRLALQCNADPAASLDGVHWLQRRNGTRKRLEPFPVHRIAPSRPLDQVLYANRNLQPARITPLSIWRRTGVLLKSVLIGLGYAQIGENMLRWDSSLHLLRILISRARVCKSLARLPGSEFQLGPDPQAAIVTLRRSLESPRQSSEDMAQNERPN